MQSSLVFGIADGPGAEAVGGEQCLAAIPGDQDDAEAAGGLLQGVIAKGAEGLRPGRSRAALILELLQGGVLEAGRAKRKADAAVFLEDRYIRAVTDCTLGKLQTRQLFGKDPAGVGDCVRRVKNTTEPLEHTELRWPRRLESFESSG